MNWQMRKVEYLKNKIYWAWGDWVRNRMNARRSNIFRLLIFATRFRLLKLLCVVLNSWNSWNSQITSTPKGGFELEVTTCPAHVGGHNSGTLTDHIQAFHCACKILFLSEQVWKKRDFIVSIAFLRLKNTIATKKEFGCLEQTRPYLRESSPRKVLYLNPLTHMCNSNSRNCGMHTMYKCFIPRMTHSGL